MVDQSSGSSRVKGKKSKTDGLPRRFWTKKEEEVLLNLLDALVAEGWKPEGTFQGGYMNRLETEINAKLPGCGLLVKHIKSKLTVWKRTHFALVGLLKCSGAAGFYMDPDLNMVIEEKQNAWADYAKVHPVAVDLLKNKTLPLHLRWRHIFGTNNAAGEGRYDMSDARDEATKKDKKLESANKEANTPSNYDGTTTGYDDEPLSSKGSSQEKTPSNKASSKKRKSITDDPSKIGSMIGEWMETTKSQFGEVSQKMMGTAPDDNTQPGDDSTKRARIYSAVSECCNLELEELVTVTRHFSHNKEDMDLFWGMPAEGREKLVQLIVRDKFH